jgi:transcriptional regulator with XRE-family HTH domain
MSVDFKLIGSRIKDMRKGRKLTQEALAEKLDYSVGYISNMERGVTKIGLCTLERIAKHLNCDVSELIQGCSSESHSYLDAEIAEVVAKLSADEKSVMVKMLEMYLESFK